MNFTETKVQRLNWETLVLPKSRNLFFFYTSLQEILIFTVGLLFIWAITVVYKVFKVEPPLLHIFLFLFLVLFIFFLIKYLKWKTLTYTLESGVFSVKQTMVDKTPGKLHIQSGFFVKKKHSIAITNFNSVELIQSFFGDFFNSAEIRLEYSGEEKNIRLMGIKNPDFFYKEIQKMIDIEKSNSFINLEIEKRINESILNESNLEA